MFTSKKEFEEMYPNIDSIEKDLKQQALLLFKEALKYKTPFEDFIKNCELGKIHKNEDV